MGKREDQEYKGVINRQNIKQVRTKVHKPEDTERKQERKKRDECASGQDGDEAERAEQDLSKKASQSKVQKLICKQTGMINTTSLQTKRLLLFCLRNAVQTSFAVFPTHVHTTQQLGTGRVHNHCASAEQHSSWAEINTGYTTALLSAPFWLVRRCWLIFSGYGCSVDINWWCYNTRPFL